MTTEELVNMEFEEFSDAIARLDGGSCERHARDLFHRLGPATSFEEYVKAMTRAAACCYGSPQDQFVEMYEVSRNHLPGVSPGYGMLAKLIGLVVRVITAGLTPPGGNDADRKAGRHT